MVVQTKPMTAEELEKLPSDQSHVELVAGEIRDMAPAGHEHGEVALAIGSILRTFVRRNKLGRAYGAETGFVLSHDPDTVRAPDAAFVTAERAAAQMRREGFFDGAPDLAVEVMSPQDSAEEVGEKVLDYLRSGTRLVWIVHPRTRTVTVYQSLANVRVLTAEDALDGGELLPGFSAPVKEIFES